MSLWLARESLSLEGKPTVLEGKTLSLRRKRRLVTRHALSLEEKPQSRRRTPLFFGRMRKPSKRKPPTFE
jgi:hypothetical protein